LLAKPTRSASLSKQLLPMPTWTGNNTSNMIRAMSVQQRSIYWLVTRRRRERLSVGKSRCVSTSWCASWWMLTWYCCRERRRDQTWNGSSKGRVHDSDRGAGSYDIVQLYDVARAHPNASVACRRPDAPLLRCAVNVDISGERVGILSLESAQPENARDDGVAA